VKRRPTPVLRKADVSPDGTQIGFTFRLALARELRPEWRNIMRSLAQKLQRFLASEDGPTAVEYAVMLALIVVSCLGAISSVGTKASSTFNTVSTSMPS
jgi:pilus assembly protein Flp/PilA